MKKFNLAYHYIKSVKEAMGYTRQRYRDQYEWWDYEELTGGGDDRWQEWTRIDRSLNRVLNDARTIRAKFTRDLMGIYGLTISEIPKVFKTYIGYHPTYGAYICSIGPYLGTTFDESMDKFGYFIIRKRKSNQEEMADAVLKNIEKYMEAYNVNLEPSDLQFVVKEPVGEFDPSRERQRKNIREVVTNLDPSSPEARDFYTRAPIAGEGSEFGLNAKGLEKVIRSQWGSLYNLAIQETATQENISVEEATQRQLRDINFLKSVYDAVRHKYEEAVERGDAAVRGMSPPPVFSKLSLQGKYGQIFFTTIKATPKEVIRQLTIRQQILGLLNQGIENPAQIQSRLNEDPRRRTGPIPLEEVEERVAEIRNLSTEKNKNYEELISETSEQITSYESNSGFSDLKTAFEQAKLYFSHLPVDPMTKGKMQRRFAPHMVFDPPENFENITSEDLKRLKAEKKSGKQEGAAAEGATKEEVSREIGEEVSQEKDKGIPQKTPVSPQEAVIEEPLEEEVETPSALQTLFESTINNLIKIAKELDKDGKTKDSEEIHKIIRKYAERIK